MVRQATLTSLAVAFLGTLFLSSTHRPDAVAAAFSLSAVATPPAAARTNNNNNVVVPSIIQGGMGVRISSWNLARTVASCGEMGVISGTCMEIVMVRQLQKGDPGAYSIHTFGLERVW